MDTQQPVVVVAPALDREPSTFGERITDLADRPRYLPVRVRYGKRRPRLADFTADVLDALGRVGTRSAMRKVQPADLPLLAPFLLTDHTDTLVVFDAGWLGVDGIEDLIATAGLADHQLWLVLGEAPSEDLTALLRAHCDPWLTLPQAADRWRQDPVPGQDAVSRLRCRLVTGRIGSDEARHGILEAARTAGPERRWALEDAHTRATVQPAISALQAVGLTDERALAQLRVEQLTPDGAEVRLTDRTIPVPTHLRRALARQRLYATVIGQRPDEQLLTYDGSRSNPSSLAWY
ncbi:MAG: hypothetical protein ACXVXD_16205 [Nocardioidaceae bacterium]